MPYTTFPNPQNRECGTFAGPQCTNTLGCFNKLLNFWCRVVRGDIAVSYARAVCAAFQAAPLPPAGGVRRCASDRAHAHWGVPALGAAVAATLIAVGWNPYLATLVDF